MKINDIMRERRKELGLTLKQVAERTGVSEGTISRWESGKISEMRRGKVAAYAKAIDIDPAIIMGWKEISEYSNLRPVSKRTFPVLGSVSCGEPVLMTEERSVQIDASDDFDADFVLIARGDSMTGARIHDGDVVFIRKQDTVDNGQIAVVAIDDEATLKRFYKYDDLIVLRAENPAYPDIEIRPGDGKQVHVLGLAIKFQGDVR